MISTFYDVWLNIPFPNIAFRKYDPTEATVMVDKRTNRSRGFGFVYFRDKASMDDAIKDLHSTELDGRRISVTRAIPQSETAPGTPASVLMRGSGRDGGRPYGGGRGGYRSAPYEPRYVERGMDCCAREMLVVCLSNTNIHTPGVDTTVEVLVEDMNAVGMSVTGVMIVGGMNEVGMNEEGMNEVGMNAGVAMNEGVVAMSVGVVAMSVGVVAAMSVEGTARAGMLLVGVAVYMH